MTGENNNQTPSTSTGSAATTSVMMPNIRPPNEFDFTKPETWINWLTRFERYVSVANLSSKSDKEKIDLLCYTMGEKSEEILKQILPDINATTTFDVVKTKFNGYFSPEVNIVYERYKFNSRIQQEGESIDVFITALHTLADTCKYGTLKNDLIRDRIVIGVRDTRTSERMQLTSDLTLEKAITMAKQAEIQTKENKNLRKDFVEVNEVNRVIKKTNASGNNFKQKGSYNNNQRKDFDLEKKDQCYRCGFRRHEDVTKCPAVNSTCRNCQKSGHWDRVCRSKKVQRIEEDDSDQVSVRDIDRYAFLGALSGNSSIKKNDFSIDVKIAEFPNDIHFLIDTGADITCISEKCVTKALKNKIIPSDKIIYGPDGRKLHVKGYMNVTISRESKNIKAKVYILQGLKNNLLGKPEISNLNLICGIFNLKANDFQNFQMLQEFDEVFDGLGQFKKKMKIHLKDEAQPYFQYTPRDVAIPLLPKLKKELDRLEKLGVISPIKSPTDWCSPIVVVPKPNTEEIRLCIDFTELNKSVKRAVHPMFKVDVLLSRLKGAKFFSKLDARAGYHQIKLDDESKLLTCFITPFGRYICERLPFGICCASDYFTCMFSELFTDLPNVSVHVDDILIHAGSKKEHDETLKAVLKRVKNAGVTLNKDKCVIAVDEIEFLGHKISEHGISVLPERISAIENFPVPENKDSLQQFLGAVAYVGKFIPNKSAVLEPLNYLLKDDVPFVWLEPQKKAFASIKNYVKQAPTLAHFDYSKNIIVQADASSYGLGAALMQEIGDKSRSVVAYASRTLTDCEKRYSQIEKEALALTFAAERFKEYITGIKVTLETDHKPLIQILQTKPLDELTPRLQRIRLRLMRYHYQVVYVPGKQLILADSLSRNPMNIFENNADDLPHEIDCYVNSIINNLPASETMLDRIKLEQEEDFICRALKSYCTNQWPIKDRLSKALLPYYQYKDSISVCNELLLYNSRLIIPPSMQLEILSKLHEGHFGLNKCRERMKQSVWWLGISTQLNNLIENCPACVQERQNIREPFVKENFPDRPWQKLGLDLFYLKRWYLIITDYYSRFFEICPLKTMTEKEVIENCKSVFSRFGIPEIVRSDCGTQFSSGFKKFAKDFDFIHITSSPKFSQSNGAAEAAVKIAKNIIKKCDDVEIGLLSYRSTPLENGYSPAELLYSRKIRSRLPTLHKNLNTFLAHEEVVVKENRRKEKQEYMYNKRHRSVKLSEINVGDTVWIIDMRLYGKVVNLDRKLNSFVMKTEKGSVIRRNRWHIIPAPYKHDLQFYDDKTPIFVESDNHTVALPNDNVQVNPAIRIPVDLDVHVPIPNLNIDLPENREINNGIADVVEQRNQENVVANQNVVIDPNDGTESSVRKSSRVIKKPARFNE